MVWKPTTYEEAYIKVPSPSDVADAAALKVRDVEIELKGKGGSEKRDWVIRALMDTIPIPGMPPWLARLVMPHVYGLAVDGAVAAYNYLFGHDFVKEKGGRPVRAVTEVVEKSLETGFSLEPLKRFKRPEEVDKAFNELIERMER